MIVVTKLQWERIKLILECFPEVDGFKLEEQNTSGIGPSTSISFETKDGVHHDIDITDVASW
jgi:hypothetical protein